MSLSNGRLTQTIRLKDGRFLGFAEYGVPAGAPVLYFTGGNSSRLEGRWFEAAAIEKHIRLIVPDRPGFGLSTFQTDRRLVDWADDMAQLTAVLGIEKTAVFGLSGGGPHVLALAAQRPQLISRAAIVSGTAPPEMPNKFKGMWPPVRLIFSTAKYVPSINRLLLKQMSNFYSDREQMHVRMKQALPKPDAELIERRPEIIDIFAQAVQEAHRQGIKGDVWEWHLYVNPWGIELQTITTPCRLWYGTYDKQVPIHMGRYLATQLPDAELVEVADGGHFSTINNHINAIFDYLVTP